MKQMVLLLKSLLNWSPRGTSKGVNKNFVATRSHNEYKDVLLNKRFWRNVWGIRWIESKVKIIE